MQTRSTLPAMYQPLRRSSENFPSLIWPLSGPMSEARFWRLAIDASIARAEAGVA